MFVETSEEAGLSRLRLPCPEATDHGTSKEKKDKKFYWKIRMEKAMAAEENNSAWADTDSEESSSGTSSLSESEDERFDKLERRRGVHSFVSADEVISKYFLEEFSSWGSADKKGERGSRGLQQPANIQKEGSAVTPIFEQRVEMAQRRIVQTVLDDDANRALLESQDAAERDRERRRREARPLKRRRRD
ncbi:hypothetical protein F511_24959 [Dorcoceras hygrometricum]|uniref:Uncharacterized protein n=1 Tax=Dorcoceras hygrometricum TaxID=472368 RepID=A0A2Z7DDB6_9LAMI|nr:hypothetical protein F511_24959 [Dorcoceras hygrometricum]